MSLEFEIKHCAICNNRFECRQENILDYACSKLNISEITINFLKNTSHDCICTACLEKLESDLNKSTL